MKQDYYNLNANNWSDDDIIIFELTNLLNTIITEDTNNSLVTQIPLVANNYSFTTRIFAIKIIPGEKVGTSISQKNHGVYNITLYEGLIKFIYDFIYVILSDNSIFKEVGSSNKLIKLLSFDYNFPKGYNDLKLDIIDANESKKTKFTKERIQLHDFLFKLTLRHIVIHEAKHIINGHIDYLNSINAKNLKDAVDKGLINLLDAKTLEMDADSISIKNLLTRHLINFENWNLPFLLKKEDLFKCVSFSLFVNFILIPSNKHSMIHINKYDRFCICILEIEGYITTNKLNIDFSKIMIKTLQDYKQTYLNISSEILDLKEILDYFTNKERQNNYQEILKNWNSILPKIEPFSLTKLAPKYKDI